MIGISGSYGGLNLGDEAILSSTVPQIRQVVPDAEIVVFTRNVEHTRRHHLVDRVLCPRDVLREEILPEIRRLDLLLLGGGGILYDYEAGAYLREVMIAHELGIPTFAFAIGVGPLHDREEQRAVRDGLERMAGITVRETGARRVLEEIGVRTPITVTADLAFLLEPEPGGEDLLRTGGLDPQNNLVALSLREAGGAAPDLSQSAYHALLADTADYIIRRFDAQVVFIPMEYADLREAHRVLGVMALPHRARVLGFDYRPRQLLAMMPYFQMAVGMRLHFLIFAALSGVPLMALPYASKVADLISALGLPRRAAVPAERSGLFLADLDRLWDERHRQPPAVAPRVEMLKAAARRTMPLAAEVILPRTGGGPIVPV
ncbi:polysaccharide pyruvyl transferase family protein [Telmatospirillum sp. J64-1]|uniref:polysaccharide pyruvyl transferase family protein n=1 Tax=Telmatospirillum sp. J64-1 TaxID=2502183 RepID=UPI001C8F3B88|nr:polysaccharide pyruvyl transferase family protein [Telmatospirillum sp. J64-1]